MRPDSNPYGLRGKQWRFVEEYLVDLNASAAYKRAGYEATGNAAEAAASRLLSTAKVTAAIQAEQAARGERVHLTQDKVLEEIKILSHSTIEHYHVDDQGNVQLAPDAPKTAMRAVSSLQKKIIHTEQGVIYETRIWLWNKPASVQMAGRHLGLFTDKVDVTGTVKVVKTPAKAPSPEAWKAARPDTIPPQAEA